MIIGYTHIRFQGSRGSFIFNSKGGEVYLEYLILLLLISIPIGFAFRIIWDSARSYFGLITFFAGLPIP